MFCTCSCTNVRMKRKAVHIKTPDLQREGETTESEQPRQKKTCSRLFLPGSLRPFTVWFHTLAPLTCMSTDLYFTVREDSSQVQVFTWFNKKFNLERDAWTGVCWGPSLPQYASMTKLVFYTVLQVRVLVLLTHKTSNRSGDFQLSRSGLQEKSPKLYSDVNFESAVWVSAEAVANIPTPAGILRDSFFFTSGAQREKLFDWRPKNCAVNNCEATRAPTRSSLYFRSVRGQRTRGGSEGGTAAVIRAAISGGQP